MSDPVSSAASSALPARSLRFGDGGRFELRPVEHRLLIDGQPAALGNRAIDLLIVLAAHPNQLLAKGDLLDRVWPGLVVEEANLHVQISSLRKLLGGQVIATVPGRGYRFSATLDQPVAPVAESMPMAAVAAAQPAPARLFGRDADLAAVELALHEPGFVTLVGSSGVGKTSLARAVAARWPAGSTWIELAAITPGVSIIDAVARALGLQAGEGDLIAQVRRALREGPTLLVLDNAEHVVDGCVELITLLRPLPEGRLLVTSQLPLAIEGEHVRRLEPLACATSSASADLTAQDLADGAVALLIERIRAADHRFEPTPAVVPQLRAICTQLDGLPLALEMAAARVPLLGLAGVHDALAQRFALLTRGRRDAPERHRTLHGALDWSYRLLDPEAQRLLRALGIFSGGFTLELAVGLMADGAGAARRWDTIDALATLVDRSLVAVSPDNPPRYRLLETMRAYALEQLAAGADPAETEDVYRGRAADLLLALFNAYDTPQPATIATCLAEMDNARAAVQWATRSGRLALAVALTPQICRVAMRSLWRQEATRWLMSLEPAMQADAGTLATAVTVGLQARWWSAYAIALLIRRDPRATAAAERSYQLHAARADAPGVLYAASIWVRSLSEAGPALDAAAEALDVAARRMPVLPPMTRMQLEGTLGFVAKLRGDWLGSLRRVEAERAIAHECGWHSAAQTAESNVVDRLNVLGRHAEAAERGRALAAEVDDANGNLPWVLSSLLEALNATGRLDEAARLAPRAWDAWQRFDEPAMLPDLARLAVEQGRFDDAGHLVGHALRVLESRGSLRGTGEERTLAHVRAALAAALGDEALGRRVAAGRQLGDDEARRIAVDEARERARS